MNKRYETRSTQFAAVPAWILTHPDLSAQAVRVYGALYLSGNWRELTSTVKMAELARMVGTSVSTVDRALDELAAIGAVEGELLKRDGVRIGTRWTLRAEGANPSPVGSPIPTGENSRSHGRDLLLALGSEDNLQRVPTEPLIAQTTTGDSQRLLFGAILQECQIDPAYAHLSASLVGKVASKLAQTGATEGDVRQFAAAYRAHWPGIDLTPTAMLKHWAAWKGGAFTPAQPKLQTIDQLMLATRKEIENASQRTGGTRNGDPFGGELPERSTASDDDR